MRAELLPSHAELERFKATALEAVTVAGKILLEYASNGFRIEHKNEVNLVTDADRRSEQAIIDIIRRAYPHHDILAEERGMASDGTSPYKWGIAQPVRDCHHPSHVLYGGSEQSPDALP